MKRSKFSEEQIIGVLKEHEGGGRRRRICAASTGSASRRSTIGRAGSVALKYPGGQAAAGAGERECQKLKKLLAEAHLDNAALKDLLTKNV